MEYIELVMLDRANEAIQAVNLSGVLFSFAEDMKKLCNIASKNGYGTDWKNNHPVTIAYLRAMNRIAGIMQPIQNGGAI